MRLIGDPARRVEADAPGRQPGAQVTGEVASRAVVAYHYERRVRGISVGERGDDVRTQRGGHERVAALASQPHGAGVLVEGV